MLTQELHVGDTGHAEWTEVFVDPISYVNKSAISPVHCNDICHPDIRWGASGIAATRT
jgi:hypothetical protein